MIWRALSKLTRILSNLSSSIATWSDKRSRAFRFAAGITDTRFRRLVKDNLKWKDKYKGRRAFVIGNGPSLHKQDLALLKDEVTIACSGFYKHQVLSLWQPTYYVIADPYFFSEKAGGDAYIRSVVEKIPRGDYVVPAESYAKALELGFKAEQTHPVFFATDFASDLVPPVGLAGPAAAVMNTLQLSIMVALWCGAREIVIIGADHDWLASQDETTHFYKGHALNGPEAPTQRLDSLDYDVRCANFVRLWKGYRHLDAIARANGVRILNATDGGFLDVFERTDYSSLFNKS